MLTLTHVSEQAVHMSHPLCLGLASTSKTVCLMSNKTRDFRILVVSTLRECPPVEECSNKALAVFCVGRRAIFFLICPLPSIYREIFGFEDSFSDEEISFSLTKIWTYKFKKHSES